MKYLLVLLVVIVGFYFWRNKRREQKLSTRDSSPASLAQPQAMVECSYCGLHLPRSDAHSDGQGQLFCSAAHRQLGPKP